MVPGKPLSGWSKSLQGSTGAFEIFAVLHINVIKICRQDLGWYTLVGD